MLSLFSGIGEIDLAAEWAGIETVAFCEIEPFCQKVLKKHWPNVPIFPDIKELRGEDVGAVDIVAGGFPCQPYSVAGKQKGEDDKRDMWPEMFRVVQEARPVWVVGENVPGILSGNGGQRISEIRAELEREGYKTRIIVSPAANYGAPFEGKRVFIIATTKSSRYGRCPSKKCRELERKLVENKQEGHKTWGETERCIIHFVRHQETLPDYLRGNYGLPDWVDRIKSLGNAVVPQQIYPIFKAIVEIEGDRT